MQTAGHNDAKENVKHQNRTYASWCSSDPVVEPSQRGPCQISPIPTLAHYSCFHHISISSIDRCHYNNIITSPVSDFNVVADQCIVCALFLILLCSILSYIPLLRPPVTEVSALIVLWGGLIISALFLESLFCYNQCYLTLPAPSVFPLMSSSLCCSGVVAKVQKLLSNCLRRGLHAD